MTDNKIVLFQSGGIHLEVQFSPEQETVWLTRQQLAELFDRDIKTIGKHISNALKEELEASTVAKFATVQREGNREILRQIEHYNLDMIISVGYRVKSGRGVEFRRWANRVLKDYIRDGYALNKQRLNQLNEAVHIMKRLEDKLDASQVLDVVKQYTTALELLDDYDHQRLCKPEGQTSTYVLSYEECRHLIDTMRFNSTSTLFGNEKDDSFRGCLGAIYQSFEGMEIYPTVEQKAANLLYFITKNHAFSDGNKRIADVFLYFLKKNGLLTRNGRKIISNHTLVAVIVMIAESQPKEKETMVKLVMNFLTNEEKSSEHACCFL